MRFKTHTLLRSVTAALTLTMLSACDIGEGNGIVSIEIVEFDGSTDFEMRADQCEGLLLGAVATFTDGQQQVYTHRVDWSIDSGNATLETLTTSTGLATAAEIIPTTDTQASDIITVRADYISLSTTQDINVTDVTISSMQFEPPVVAAITGENAQVSVVAALSDGTLLNNPLRALEAEINTEEQFTLSTSSFDGRQVLSTTETPNNTIPTTLSATFCARLDDSGTTPNTHKRTLSLTATHYSGGDASLQITENFDAQGAMPATPVAETLPAGSQIALGAQLSFPNGVTRELIAGIADWSASDSEGECSDTNECAATVDTSGRVTNATAGQTIVTASFTTPDNVTLNADQNLLLNVVELVYQDPAFIVLDENKQAIDLGTTTPSLPNAAIRTLRYVAQLIDNKGDTDDSNDTHYQLPANPNYSVNDPDTFPGISGSNNTITAAGDSAYASVQIDVNESLLPGFSESAFISVIPNFNIEVHNEAPGNIFLDSDSSFTDDETGTTINMVVGEQLQLQALLPFAGKDTIVRTSNLPWSVDDGSIVAVGNNNTTTGTDTAGLITALQPGTANVSVTSIHTQLDDTVHRSSATIQISVSAAP